jgi:hypothetical protein
MAGVSGPETPVSRGHSACVRPMWAVLALPAELAHMAGNPWQREGRVARIGRAHPAGLPEARHADHAVVAAVGVDLAVAVITPRRAHAVGHAGLDEAGRGLRYGGLIRAPRPINVANDSNAAATRALILCRFLSGRFDVRAHSKPATHCGSPSAGDAVIGVHRVLQPQRLDVTSPPPNVASRDGFSAEPRRFARRRSFPGVFGARRPGRLHKTSARCDRHRGLR